MPRSDGATHGKGVVLIGPLFDHQIGLLGGLYGLQVSTGPNRDDHEGQSEANPHEDIMKDAILEVMASDPVGYREY